MLIFFRAGVLLCSFMAQKMDERNRQMKESVSIHHTGLPPSLLRMFESRPAPPYVEPRRRKKPLLPYTGVAEYVQYFSEGNAESQDVNNLDEDAKGRGKHGERLFVNPEFGLQCSIDGLTRLERMVAAKREKGKKNEAVNEENAEAWDPAKDPNVEGDPMKTLFIANLSFDVSERKLRKEFEEYGPINRIRLVHDKFSGKPKGYAFVEFEHTSDMKEAYKMANGQRIEGRRCLVDIERGRTVPDWKPKKLGGGKGGSSRNTMLPKDPQRQRLLKIVYDALDIEPLPYTAAAPVRDTGREMRDSRDSRYRERSHYRDEYQPSRRDRSYRDRYDRDSYRGHRSRSRDRSRDRSRRRSHSHERYDRNPYSGRKRERSFQGNDTYAEIPPPESLGGPPAPDLDEPEEGEVGYVPDSKRTREEQ